MLRKMPVFRSILGTAILLHSANSAIADGNLNKVSHIIIVMQESYSFDNYFGALAYAPANSYHNGNATCAATDHKCVDSLTCTVTRGVFRYTNSNPDDNGSTVVAFKATSRYVKPDLDHSWVGTHKDMNFSSPNRRTRFTPG